MAGTPPMRLQRALARVGIASRRHAEELIAAGRVRVDGEPAHLGQSIDPERARVEVDGRRVDVRAAPARWIVLHKPRGVMTTSRDPEGRKTVFDLVPAVPGLTYVGRLDFLTEGVLLLTTDGEAAHRLTHPATEVERVYVATVTGNVKEAAEHARRGVELEDGVAKPDWVEVHPLAHRRWGFEIALREGRTREVRRICEILGLEVERLVRTRFGPVLLGALAPGQARDLSARERALVEALAHGRAMPRSRPTPRGKTRPAPTREGAAGKGRGESPGRPARPRPAARTGDDVPARESRGRGATRPGSASKAPLGRKPLGGGAGRSRVLGEQGRRASTRRPTEARPKARGSGGKRSS